MEPQSGHPIMVVTATVLRIVFGAARAVALALTVLPIVFMSLIILLPLIGGANIEWLVRQVLLLTNTSEMHTSFDTADIFKIFGTIAFVFFLVVALLRLVGLNLKLSFKKGVLLICAIYGVLLIVGLMTVDDGDMAAVLISFGILSLISYVVWYACGMIPRAVSQIRPATKEEIENFKKRYPEINK